MKIYFRNEQTGYDIDKGWTYIKNANETLDSAVVRISHLTTKLDIQPFDNVHIEDDSETPVPILNFAGGALYTLYLCVDSYQEQQVSLDPVIYNYEIHLFSETKKLENIILPNLSITPKKHSRPLTIREFIEQLWTLYCPRNRDNTFKYTLPNPWDSKFSRVCPEKQWTTPTLRDVLNDLAMVCDCIPTMANNTINFLDITNKKSAITSYNYITRSHSSQDYATDLKMNLQNVMQENKQVYTCNYKTYTCNEGILTTDNLYIETQFPILKVNHLWINWITTNPYGSNNGTCVYMRADLCNLSLRDDVENGINKYYSIVKEKKEYDITPISKFINLSDFGWYSAKQYSECKNSCLYFSRGDNKIYGFSKVNKTSLMGTDQLSHLIIQLAELDFFKRKYGEYGLNTASSNIAYLNTYDLVTWAFPTFEIEYETTKECVFSAGKKEILRNERTIMDNQTNAWVNAESQGNLEYQKANRIGNEIAMINQRITDGNPADIFQRLGNEIIYRTEYQIFDNYVDVNAYATKDYILKDYFTGVNSKIRTWVNAQDEAFIRHDLYKYYVEIDEENTYNDTYINSANDYHSNITIKNVVSSLSTSLADNIKYALIRCDDYPASDKFYITDIIKRTIGNSIVLTWGFNDNYIAMKTFNYGTHSGSDTLKKDGNVFRSDFSTVNGYITGDYKLYTPSALHDDLGSWGGVPMKILPYCNQDGNFENLKVMFSANLTGIPKELDEHTKDNYWDSIIAPTGASGNEIFSLDAKVYKDNKEIITGSLQIEYINTSNNIYLYDDFLKLNHMITDEQVQGLNLRTANNLASIPALVLDETITVSCFNDPQWTNDYSTQVTIGGTLDVWAYIYSGDTPLIRINANQIRSFYINLLRKRDKTGL